MCGSRLIGKQRIDRKDRGYIALFQQRLERADRKDLAEELELELLAPGCVIGIRKGRDPSAAGVVDEDIATTSPFCDIGSKLCDVLRLDDIASARQQVARGEFRRKAVPGAIEATFIAPTQGDIGALPEQQPHGGEPNAGRAAGHDNDAAPQAEIHLKLSLAFRHADVGRA